MKRRRHGFTLVELLVVIAIIAVLISILLPTLGSARFAASRTACLSNIHQILLAAVNYAQDNRNKTAYPAGAGPSDNYPPTAAYGITNMDILSKYFGANDNIKYDPAGPKDFKYSSGTTSVAFYSFMPVPGIKKGLSGTAVNWGTASSVTIRYPNFSEIARNSIMVCDVLRTASQTVHLPRKGAPSYNIGFRDGSARSVQSQGVYDRIKTAFGSAWANMADFTTVLTMISEGQDPQLGSGHTYTWQTSNISTYYPATSNILN